MFYVTDQNLLKEEEDKTVEPDAPPLGTGRIKIISKRVQSGTRENLLWLRTKIIKHKVQNYRNVPHCQFKIPKPIMI